MLYTSTLTCNKSVELRGLFLVTCCRPIIGITASRRAPSLFTSQPQHNNNLQSAYISLPHWNLSFMTVVVSHLELPRSQCKTKPLCAALIDKLTHIFPLEIVAQCSVAMVWPFWQKQNMGQKLWRHKNIAHKLWPHKS